MKKVIIGAVAALLLTGSTATASSLITGAKVKDSSITGRDIKNRSLTPADFHGSVRGPQGPAGPQGAQGPQGAPGLTNVSVVESERVYSSPGQIVAARAYCPAGTRVIGTGFYASISQPGFVMSYGTFVGAGFANNSSIVDYGTVQATCASVSGGNAAAARAASVTGHTFSEDFAAFKAKHS